MLWCLISFQYMTRKEQYWQWTYADHRYADPTSEWRIDMTNETITNQNQAPVAITAEQLAAILAQNQALIERLTQAEGTLKAIQEKEEAAKEKARSAARKRFLEEPITMKASEKGCLSVGNLGNRYPVSLRPCQWRKLLAKAGAILGALEDPKIKPNLVDWTFDGKDADFNGEFDPSSTPAEKAAAIVKKAA